MVTILDTIREVTTITVRENAVGDTLSMSTVTERDRVHDRSRLNLKRERQQIKTDTVFVERQAETTISVAGPNIEVDGQGNVVGHVSRLAQTLKWLFFTIIAMTLLIIIVRLRVRR